MSDVVSTVKTITESFSKNNEAINDNFKSVYDRLENLEAVADRPRLSNAAAGAAYTKHSTPKGAVYAVPSGTRLADVKELRPNRPPEVSLARWLRALVAGESCQDKQAIDFALEQKQMLTTSTGVLLPQQYQTQWIDLLRAQSVLVKAGMNTLVMDAKIVNMSAVTADPTAAWHTENASINAANPTFAARALTATTLVTRCTASLELSQDSPDMGTQLAAVMTKSMAAELDRCGLEGTGTPPQPRGIKNTTGRSTITGVGSPADYSKIVAGLGKLLGNNNSLADVNQFAVMGPNAWAAFQNLVTGISGDKSPLERPAALDSMEFLVTSNVAGSAATSPQTLSTIYLGDFRALTLGVRLESSIEILKLTSFATNLILEFIGYLRADFVVTRPASFCTLEGVLGSTT